MKHLITALVFLSSLAAVAQEIHLSGNYYGFSLFVNNPASGSGWCVTSVTVNDKPAPVEIRSAAFEIDFSLMGIRQGDPVQLVIRHTKGCLPEIVNPGALQSKESFSFTYIKVDKNGKVLWGAKGESGDEPFVVEQFRWNKWLKIAEVSPEDTIKPGHYMADTYPHTGQNTFRVVRRDASGNLVQSKITRYVSRAAEITLESTKVTDKLIFSSETFYEIFDAGGNFLSDGFAWEVDVSDLEKGKYWLNYDAKSVTFTKK